MRSRHFPAPPLLLSLAAVAGAFTWFDPENPAAVPMHLSQTGLYTNIATKTLDTAFKPFEVNSPLWSDGAAKQRGIILRPGRSVPYDDTTDLFDYPDSTVFVKTFLLDPVRGDSTERVHWETRLLVNKRADGVNTWHGFTYAWNAAQTDARLVDRETGFDTTFIWRPNGPDAPESYLKWRFPSRQDCATCHLPGGREVLGFLPAQLKRPSVSNPLQNQVNTLFDAGVLTGTRPSAEQLRRRWRGIAEGAPKIAGPERFRVLDTMARAYLAANCSGCHGTRAIEAGSGVPNILNYDFHRLRPVVELGRAITNTASLETDDTASPFLYGRRYLIESIVRAGIDTAAGKPWHMTIPPGESDPNLLHPGHPAWSTILYRQVVRRTPWRDSSETRRRIAEEGDPEGWGVWMFDDPWGSAPWRAELARRGIPLSAVAAHVRDGGSSGGQMPPVAASFLPDAEALELLAEWVRDYRTLVVVDSTRIFTGLRAAPQARSAPPALQGRRILLPSGIDPRGARLHDARGRAVPLLRADGGRTVEIPPAAPRGLYWLRVDESTWMLLVE